MFACPGHRNWTKLKRIHTKSESSERFINTSDRAFVSVIFADDLARYSDANALSRYQRNQRAIMIFTDEEIFPRNTWFSDSVTDSIFISISSSRVNVPEAQSISSIFPAERYIPIASFECLKTWRRCGVVLIDTESKEWHRITSIWST